MATPFGALGISSDGQFLRGIEFLPPGHSTTAPANYIAEMALQQLEHYLADPDYRFPESVTRTAQSLDWHGFRAFFRSPAG